MDLKQEKELVERVRSNTEAFGYDSLQYSEQSDYGALAINLVSIGALTHSSKALDISLELEPPFSPPRGR